MARAAERLPPHATPEDKQACDSGQSHDEDRREEDRPLKREVGDPDRDENQRRDRDGGGDQPSAHECESSRVPLPVMLSSFWVASTKPEAALARSQGFEALVRARVDS